jgi:protein-tyrosine phosphatase
MKYHHNSLKEAYLYLIEKRPQIWPNEGFLIQLIRYEDELLRSGEIKGNVITNEENPIETLNEFENKHKIDV